VGSAHVARRAMGSGFACAATPPRDIRQSRPPPANTLGSFGRAARNPAGNVRTSWRDEVERVIRSCCTELHTWRRRGRQPRSTVGRLGAWQWRSAWEADPRCTQLAKHRNCWCTALTAMRWLPSMRPLGQIRRDQKRNVRDCRVPVQAGSSVSVDNLGSRRANAPPLSGIAQYHSTQFLACANESPSIRIRRKAHTRRLPFDYNFCRLQK